MLHLFLEIVLHHDEIVLKFSGHQNREVSLHFRFLETVTAYFISRNYAKILATYKYY